MNDVPAVYSNSINVWQCKRTLKAKNRRGKGINVDVKIFKKNSVRKPRSVLCFIAVFAHKHASDVSFFPKVLMGSKFELSTSFF